MHNRALPVGENGVFEINRIFAEQIYKVAGCLSCPMFDTTENINQLIDYRVKPWLYFASSIINDMIGNLAFQTESTEKRVNSARV